LSSQFVTNGLAAGYEGVSHSTMKLFEVVVDERLIEFHLHVATRTK
jgi:hypothetical protein